MPVEELFELFEEPVEEFELVFPLVSFEEVEVCETEGS